MLHRTLDLERFLAATEAKKNRRETQNNNSVRGSVWVRHLVSHINARTWPGGFPEQGDEDNT
jgi:hypothetical protein